MLTQTQCARLTQKIQSALGEKYTIVRFPGCIGIRCDNEIVRRFKTEQQLREWVLDIESRYKVEQEEN